MSSIAEALLFEPYPFEIWVAVRPEKGTGTLNDPYGAATATAFDTLMNSLPANVRVNLGPGTFLTKGYSDEVSGGWQIKAGMQIVGSGVDVTTLQLADVQSGGTTARVFAIGHALVAGNPLVPNLVDLAAVSDLTIDANLAAQTGTAIACGAVRLMGNHVRILRVKAKKWGTTSAATPCYVFALITGDRTASLAEVANAGIEDCFAVEPGASPSNAPVTAFHAGGKELAVNNAEAYGRSPYIRNCFVDCGSPTAGPEYRGLSMSWCKGGVVEGNQVLNTKYGGPCGDKASIGEVIVRNNLYKNVVKGPFWNLGVLNPATPTSLSTLVRDTTFDPTGKTALATSSGDHNLQLGERVKIDASAGTPSQFKGMFVISHVPAGDQFRYRMLSDPGGNASSPTMQKVIGVSKLLMEGNAIELATGATGELAIHLKDVGTSSAAQPPDYPHGDIIIRQNRIRYLDGQFDSGYNGSGIEIDGAKNVIVSDNLAICAPISPIKEFRCGTATFFNNKSPSGALIQGFDGDTNIKYGELETAADDALLMTLL